jgi:hypothetical protein
MIKPLTVAAVLAAAPAAHAATVDPAAVRLADMFTTSLRGQPDQIAAVSLLLAHVPDVSATHPFDPLSPFQLVASHPRVLESASVAAKGARFDDLRRRVRGFVSQNRPETVALAFYGALAGVDAKLPLPAGQRAQLESAAVAAAAKIPEARRAAFDAKMREWAQKLMPAMPAESFVLADDHEAMETKVAAPLEKPLAITEKMESEIKAHFAGLGMPIEKVWTDRIPKAGGAWERRLRVRFASDADADRYLQGRGAQFPSHGGSLYLPIVVADDQQPGILDSMRVPADSREFAAQKLASLSNDELESKLDALALEKREVKKDLLEDATDALLGAGLQEEAAANLRRAIVTAGATSDRKTQEYAVDRLVGIIASGASKTNREAAMLALTDLADLLEPEARTHALRSLQAELKRKKNS